MGNHSSNHQGQYNFPTATACVLGDERPVVIRSQSLIHERTRSHKYSAFGIGGKGRRCTIDCVSSKNYLGLEGTQSKKTKANSTLINLDHPPSQEENKYSLTVEESVQVAWSPSVAIIKAKTEAKQVTRMSINLDKFVKQLAQLSKSELAQNSAKKNLDDHSICRAVFQKHVVPQSSIVEEYLWDYFMGFNAKSSTLKSSAFIEGAEKIYAPITDKDQISLYVKVFGRGKDSIERNAFMDLLISAYQLSSSRASTAGRDLNNSDNFDGKEWIESIVKSCFHIKEEMSVFFVSNWVLVNLQRLLIPMHKYLVHQLTTGYSRMTVYMKQKDVMKNSDQTEKEESGASNSAENTMDSDIHPILMWLLLASLPSSYLAVLEKNAEPAQVKQLINSRDFLLQLLYNQSSHTWSMLYNSVDQGLSVNRFQFHVFNYRGPTLMFIKCDNDYTFLIGADVEWKESCHFWGGENCVLMQLKPEFRVVEKGAKCLYANFSIRGYPFGIQIGQDPRNVSLEIKPDFEYAYFKKIPCRIINFVVWGCAASTVKNAQAEQKKWEAKQSEKQRKIDLTNVDWGDNPDKYLLELGGNYKSYGS